MSDLSKPIQLHFCSGVVDFPFNSKGVLLLFFIGVLTSHGTLAHSNVTGKVVSVIDGNTIEVYTQENRKLKVLLDGIDSPELGQEYGSEAKKFLEEIVLNKEVVVEFKGKDPNGNHVAVVMMDSRVDLRVELLKEGLAWTSEKGSSKDLEPYKTWAQRKGRGLWQQENPVPPWTYRKQQAMVKPKIR